MTSKPVQRYSNRERLGYLEPGDWCTSADVAALEAERDKQDAELTRLRAVEKAADSMRAIVPSHTKSAQAYDAAKKGEQGKVSTEQ